MQKLKLTVLLYLPEHMAVKPVITRHFWLQASNIPAENKVVPLYNALINFQTIPKPVFREEASGVLQTVRNV